MLTQLSISGFRCFKQLDVELKPLTVLIGPNDSGKSTFLETLKWLESRKPDAQPMQPTKLDCFRNGDAFLERAEALSEVTATTLDGYQRSFTLNRPERESGGSHVGLKWRGSPSLDVTNDLRIELFHLPSGGIETECAGFSLSDMDSMGLEANGRRVAALLDHLLRNDLERFLELRLMLKELVCGLEDLKIDTPRRDSRRIDLVIDGGLRIPASRASAGVRLLLFFLALVHHPKPPGIILLEEPETGIHPKRLAEVMQLVRGITKGQYGNRAAQVILTTHSPYLLDYVNPDEDQVLVFQREADGSRTAKPVDWNRLKEYFDGFMLGEIWFNEEEAGLVAQGRHEVVDRC